MGVSRPYVNFLGSAKSQIETRDNTVTNRSADPCFLTFFVQKVSPPSTDREHGCDVSYVRTRSSESEVDS